MNVSTGMKVHTAIFPQACLHAIMAMRHNLMFALVKKGGKGEFVISQFVIMIVVLKVIVYYLMSVNVILDGNPRVF